MYRLTLLLVLFASGLFAANSPRAEEVDTRQIIVRISISTKIEAHSSRQSTILITAVDKSKSKRVKLEPGYLALTILDERDGEFSIRLDLFDANESVLNSKTLVTTDEQVDFSLSTDRVFIEGSISINTQDHSLDVRQHSWLLPTK